MNIVYCIVAIIIVSSSSALFANNVFQKNYDLHAINPNLQGFSKNFSYQIQASSLRTKSSSVFDLIDVNAMFHDNLQQIKVYSQKGQFNYIKQILTLKKNVRIVSKDCSIHSDFAEFDINSKTLIIKTNLQVDLKNSTLKAHECKIMGNLKDIKCYGVKANINFNNL